MKTVYKFIAILILPIGLLLFSFSSGSPGSKTGSVGDGGVTCTQCHSGTEISQSGWITTNIPAEGYTAGETYEITITGTHEGVGKMGFELTSENTVGTKLGIWEITDAGRTQLMGESTAVTHTFSGTTPTDNTSTWMANWTAPATGSGDINFNAAVNAANGNGSTSGDVVYTTIVTYQEAEILNPQITSVDPNHAPQDWIGEVVISGSETMWLSDGVGEVIFKFHDSNLILLTPDSFTTNSDTEILCNFSIPVDQELGVYDVYVDDIMMANGFTVDILDDVSEQLSSNIKIYPNPAVNFLNIDLPENSEFRIVNIYGSQITDFVVAEKSSRIDITDLEKGVYFVQIINKGVSSSKKFIKN